MLFNSPEYFLLLGSAVFFYWILSSTNIRMLVLFVSSAIFYISWSLEYYVLLLGVLFYVWLVSILFLEKKDKRWLVVTILVLIGILVYFKYANFFLENINALLDPNVGFSALHIILPLGISFYVFQILAYCIDVYTGKICAERNPLVFFTFITFFPQLIAGPICRGSELLPQLLKKQFFSVQHIFEGGILLLCGLSLKVAVADRVAPFVNVVFDDPGQFSGMDNGLAIVGFGVQILCDFWGYSLIAVGSGRLFALSLPFNFNLPYSARTIADFWRRWHITLSSWLRDYLYIPLGGNRGSEFKTARNLFVTMLLGGLWHGASWNFVIWGGIHGAALIVQRYYRQLPLAKGFEKIFNNSKLSWSATMLIVFLSWVFFRANGFGVAIEMLSRVLLVSSDWFKSKLPIAFFEILVIFLPLHYLIHKLTYGENLILFGFRYAPVFVPIIALFTLVYYTHGSDFIYFQF